MKRLALICFSAWSAYMIIWTKVKQNIYNQASQDMIGAIVYQVQNKGEITIFLQDSEIILVPKVAQQLNNLIPQNDE